jgi:uncharacterized protein (TIGR02452 family)
VQQPRVAAAVQPGAGAAKVLAVFWASGLRRLVLGAWGCGVFRNPPASVAAAFAEHLGPSGQFHSSFEHVISGVLDRAPGTPTFAALATPQICI